MIRIKIIHLLVLVGLLVASCSQKSKSSGTSSSTPKVSSTSKKSTSSVASLSLAGKAKGFITSSFLGVATGKLALALGLTDSSTNGCESGKYTISGVGYDTAFGSGTFSGSTFKIDAPNTDALIDLSCSDGTVQRCFVKSGDDGVLCNKVADSIITAFEEALGKKLTDKSFRGAAISKIASSIVASTQISSPETDQFIADLKACESDSNKQTCLTSAIQRSPFFDAFKIMQQIVTGWSAEGLFLFVTGVLGKSVAIDSMIYTSIFDVLAEQRGDGFIEGVRKLISDVVKSQQNQDGKYAFAIKCDMNINGTDKYIEPALDSSDHLSCNQDDIAAILKSAGIDSKYLDDIINNNLHDAVTCTASNAGSDGCWANLSMLATAINTEANRNDIDGTHENDRGGGNDNIVSMVDVMPQVDLALQKQHIDDGGNGPVVTAANKNAFKKVMDETKNYFLGLLGVYKFLNDADMKTKKFSLNDLYDIFVGSDFMNSRLSAWGPNVTGVQVSTDNNNQWYQPILTPTSDPSIFSLDSMFLWSQDKSGSQNTASAAALSAILKASEPSFDTTLGQFVKIPTANEISDFVYNSSHHEEWNPMGSKFEQVAEFGSKGIPITCKLENAGAGQSLISNSTVSCDTTQKDVTCTAEGYCSFPDSYEYPYILMGRGWYGDDKGQLFSLASASNGLELRSNGGNGVMIKEFKSGNEEGKCDSTQVGKVINYIEEFYCGPNVKCEQKNTAFCMDMSAFGTPARKRFYPGGQLTVTNQDPSTGKRWDWMVPLIGAYDGADHSKDTSVCLQVPTGTFIASDSGNVATAHVNVSTGFLSLTGVTGAVIKDCSSDASSGFVKYYLYNWNDFAGTDPMYAWLLDATQKTTIQYTSTAADPQHWESTYAKLAKVDVESLLTKKTIAGSAATQINNMRFHNPRHDPKFDPYCDDVNGNGKCDCYAVKTISADKKTITYEDTIRTDAALCGLMDKAAEPTLSQLPYCAQCSNASDAEGFFDKFGGKSGGDLAGVSDYFQTHQPNFDVNSAAYCKFLYSDQTEAGQPTNIDWGHWEQSTHKGCPASAGASHGSNDAGPIRIVNPKSMRNAFNVDHPNTLIKLINYATKTVGQGVTIDPKAPVFSSDEAMALLALLTLLPPDHFTVLDANKKKLDGMSVGFQSVRDPSGSDHNSNAFSSILKGILFKAGIISKDDLSVKAPAQK